MEPKALNTPKNCPSHTYLLIKVNNKEEDKPPPPFKNDLKLTNIGTLNYLSSKILR